MKKLMVSALGLMLVAFFAMPAAAERGDRRELNSYHNKRPAHSFALKHHGHKILKHHHNRGQRQYRYRPGYLHQGRMAKHHRKSPRVYHHYKHHSRPLVNHLTLGFSGCDGFASKMILMR